MWNPETTPLAALIPNRQPLRDQDIATRAAVRAQRGAPASMVAGVGASVPGGQAAQGTNSRSRSPPSTVALGRAVVFSLGGATLHSSRAAGSILEQSVEANEADAVAIAPQGDGIPVVDADLVRPLGRSQDRAIQPKQQPA